MYHRKQGRVWLMVVLSCVLPLAAMISGCGGGLGDFFPDGIFVGDYEGSLRVTSGPDQDGTADVLLVVDDDGTITGGAVDADGNEFEIVGEADLDNGEFVADILLLNGDVIGDIVGEFQVNGSEVTGEGTFRLDNGNQGFIDLDQVPAKNLPVKERLLAKPASGRTLRMAPKKP